MSDLKVKKTISPPSNKAISVQKRKINTPKLTSSILQLQQKIGNKGVQNLFESNVIQREPNKQSKNNYPSHPMHPAKRKNKLSQLFEKGIFDKDIKLYARNPKDFFKLKVQQSKNKELESEITNDFIYILALARLRLTMSEGLLDTGIDVLATPSTIEIADFLVSPISSEGMIISKIKNKFEYTPPDFNEIITEEIKDEMARTPSEFKNFFNLIHDGGDFDVKNTRYAKYQESGVILAGKKYNVDVTGNILYGYLGRSAGFSSNLLLVLAGLSQYNSDKKKKIKIQSKDSNYDDPRDQAYISLGIRLYEEQHKSLNEKVLGKYLQSAEEEYQENTGESLEKREKKDTN